MLGFIESPRQRRDKNSPQPDQPQIAALIFMGLLLINTVTFSFIPISQTLSLQIILLFMVLVFLPLIFLAIYLASKFGYGILFAGFLSLPGAAISVFVLGDFFGVLMGRILIEDIEVRKSIYYSHSKVFEFVNPILLEEKAIVFSETQTFGQRPGGSSRFNTIRYKIVPIVDSNYLANEKIGTWAICTLPNLDSSDCNWDSRAKGGIQVSKSLRYILLSKVKEEVDALGIESWQSPIFLYWMINPKDRILVSGYYGIGFLLFLNAFWIGSVILYYRLYGNSQNT